MEMILSLAWVLTATKKLFFYARNQIRILTTLYLEIPIGFCKSPVLYVFGQKTAKHFPLDKMQIP